MLLPCDVRQQTGFIINVGMTPVAEKQVAPKQKCNQALPTDAGAVFPRPFARGGWGGNSRMMSRLAWGSNG